MKTIGIIMEVPEKIYLPVNPETGSPCYRLTGPKDNYIGSVEYTRTDTFLKKASEWLRYNNDLIDGDVDDYVEDFVNYMKANS